MKHGNNGMSEFERRFGKYAIPNLSLILVICYVTGYLIQLFNSNFISYLTLNPYEILFHGQVWRLLTWIVIPPDSLDFFTILMLIFYFSIGTSLERTWGTYRYNVYILGGMLLTIAASFVCMGGCYLFYGDVMSAGYADFFFSNGSYLFSTYYINMSIFLAYAITFPENQVLLMFVIPIKVKWLGVAYSVLLILYLISYGQAALIAPLYGFYWFGVVAIGVSLLNFLLFWLRTRNLMNLNPKQVKRRAQFRQQMRAGEHMSASHGHRCSICGRTDADDPTLEFRYCSKCKGNHEYCQYHLFTHEHIK